MMPHSSALASCGKDRRRLGTTGRSLSGHHSRTKRKNGGRGGVSASYADGPSFSKFLFTGTLYAARAAFRCLAGLYAPERHYQRHQPDILAIYRQFVADDSLSGRTFNFLLEHKNLKSICK